MRRGIIFTSGLAAAAAYSLARLEDMKREERQRREAVTSTVEPEPMPAAESEKARYERTRTTRRKSPEALDALKHSPKAGQESPLQEARRELDAENASFAEFETRAKAGQGDAQ
jgi:hypothetical protein